MADIEQALSAIWLKLTTNRYPLIGSRPRFRTALHRLTASRPHRDGSTGMNWWRTSVPPRPRRWCKHQLRPCALPVIGAQSPCCPDLLGASNRCFHWISFLGGELRICAISRFGADQRNRTAIIARAARGTPNIPGPHDDGGQGWI
jgi:hypothetical protein